MTFLNYFLIVFGLFEIISNLTHILKGSVDKIAVSAKKQHQELPLDIPNKHFFIKSIIMLIFGIIFLTTGLFILLEVPSFLVLTWISTVSFGLYGFVQAIMFKKEIKIWPAMIVYNIPVIVLAFS